MAYTHTAALTDASMANQTTRPAAAMAASENIPVCRFTGREIEVRVLEQDVVWPEVFPGR